MVKNLQDGVIIGMLAGAVALVVNKYTGVSI
jgi:hypothetical protein